MILSLLFVASKRCTDRDVARIASFSTTVREGFRRKRHGPRRVRPQCPSVGTLVNKPILCRPYTTSNGTSADEQLPRQSCVVTGNVPRGGVGIAAGQIAKSRRRFTLEDVRAFADLIQDPNPLHQSSDDSSETNDDTVVVVHGMLVASLFSHIFGTLIPGTVYRQQSLKFRQYVHVHDTIVGEVRVLKIRSLPRKDLRIVKCATTVYLEETQKVCVEGEAEVVLTDYASRLDGIAVEGAQLL